MKTLITTIIIFSVACFGFSGCTSSTDAVEEVWQKVNAPASHVNTFISDKNGILYVGTDDGIYVSTNNADAWSKKGLSGMKVTALGIDSAGKLFAGIQSGVVISTDAGASWIATTNGLPTSDTIGIVNSFAFQNSNIVLVGLSGGSTNKKHGLYKSTTAGASWSKLDSLFFSDIYATAIAPDGTYLAGGPGHLSFSTNSGKHWEQYTQNTPNTFSLATSTDGHAYAGVLYAGGATILYISSDYGVTWPRGATFPNTAIVTVPSIAVSPGNRVFAGSNPLGVYTSIDNNNFTVFNGGFEESSPAVRSLVITKNGTIFSANDVVGGTKIYRTKKSGY